MQRWVLTTSLAAAAIAGVWLAPHLRGRAPAPRPVPVPARADGPVEITARLDERVLLRGDDASRWLVVGLAAPPDPDAARVPGDVALVIDVSGSMAADRKIENARAAGRALIDRLEAGDRFALVVFDDRARVLASGPYDPARREALHALVDGLEPGGGTNVWDGLEAGHGLFGDGELQRRVLLVSDGNANQGVTEPAAFRSLAERWRGDGVIVSAIGLGEGFNEVLLEGLADSGGGNYAFVASPSELAGVVGREMDEAARTVARDLTVDVSVPAGVAAVDVPGWEWHRIDGGVRVFAGSLAAGQERKIVVEVKPDAGSLGTTRVADVRADYTLIADGSARSGAVSVDATVTDDASLAAASADATAKGMAARAQSAKAQAEAAEMWRKGDSREARVQLRRSQLILKETSAQYGIPELQDEADSLDALGYMDANMAAKASGASARGMGR
ncbi:MAG: vWA domain-containing protein [Myxococcota bacterium]